MRNEKRSSAFDAAITDVQPLVLLFFRLWYELANFSTEGQQQQKHLYHESVLRKKLALKCFSALQAQSCSKRETREHFHLTTTHLYVLFVLLKSISVSMRLQNVLESFDNSKFSNFLKTRIKKKRVSRTEL